jgi:uncharacterized protein (TIGR02453 family)
MERPLSFDGFSDETFRYLAELTANNEKAWFEANRARYEACYLAPALAFIEAIGPRLRELPGDVRYEARVNGSLFRVNRDVRFSKDKTPYKNHVDMWFWQGERKGWESPGYYMRLLPDEIILGAGMHSFSKEGLTAFRQAVLDDVKGAALEEVVASVSRAGPYAVAGESRKTVPRGFDPGHPRARLLRYEALNANLAGPIPSESADPGFVDSCFGHFKAVSPINAWLTSVFKGH